MTLLRDWLGWAATWVLVIQVPIWVAVALDAWQERTDPTLDPMTVASWVPALAYVAGAALPLALLLVVAGLRTPVAHRAGMFLGAAGLAVAAVAFTGFPEGVVGEWTVVLTGLTAVCAFLVAVLSPGERATAPAGAPPSARSNLLPGVALVVSGLFAAWTCWRGGTYWDWRGESARTYVVGLAASALLVGLGLTVHRWAAVGSRLLRWLLMAAGLFGVLWALAGVSYLFGGDALYRWEEIESPWDYGVPFLLLGTGLLAAAVAAWRRRGDLVAWSLASAMSLMLLSLWQQSTWGSVMR